MEQTKYQSLWIGTTPDTHYPSLSHEVEVDVAIIGGGIAGLMAAYFLHRKGKKVAVIEAFRIATGTTGHTTAKITSLQGLKYSYLHKYFGKDGAQTYAESHQWAIKEIANIIQKEKIDCDFMRLPSLTYSTSKHMVEKVQKEVEITHSIGLKTTFLKELPELPFSVTGAIKLENQATFHPRKCLLALAEIIVKGGNHIFENTRATDIKEVEPCEVITDKGSIKAKDVIIATNYPFYDKAFFFARMNQIRSYALGVEIEDKLPEGMYLGEESNGHSIRPHISDDTSWLIIGGEDHVSGEDVDTKEKYQKLEEFARSTFKVKHIPFKWSAQDSSPIDQIPLIGRQPHSKHIYVTTGYNEWGMTTSILSAKILTDLIQDKKNDWTSLYSPTRVKPLASASGMVEQSKHVIEGFFKYLTAHNDIKQLKNGKGTVTTYNGEKVAVFKDQNGKIHALSAICTHMGCIVEWNNAERSWDCPCHGSRFTTEGKVINGPAVKDLPEKHITK